MTQPLPQPDDFPPTWRYLSGTEATAVPAQQ